MIWKMFFNYAIVTQIINGSFNWQLLLTIENLGEVK